MRTADFDYDLPPELVAQTPAEPRDRARLMVVDRASGTIEHRLFRDIGDYLARGDRLVVNDSRVFPARLRGRKASGGEVELLLLRPAADVPHAADEATTWTCLVRGRVRAGTRLRFGADRAAAATGVAAAASDTICATVVATLPDGTRTVAFDIPPAPHLDRLGETPLPPYIQAAPADPGRYQTVYADPVGSAAAPTAGLHFTADLIAALRARGVDWSTVTLHIGLDTFRPVEAERVADHRVHREWAALDTPAAEAINATRRAGGRIVAVGTTTVRVLETAAGGRDVVAGGRDVVAGGRDVARSAAGVGLLQGWTDLFIAPGYAFSVVDVLVTNFHLPRSSLLMLVAAFAGKALVDRAYDEAIRERYRFYSFGDAMLIL